MAISLKKQKAVKQVNQVGAAEVDQYRVEKLHGWAAVKAFFKSKKTRSFLWGIIRTVLLVGLCWLILYPLLVQFSASLKTAEDIYDPTVIFIPRHVTLANYTAMWKYIDYPTLFLGSVASSLGLGLLQMASCTLVAYGLARFKFKGNGMVFFLVIATLIVPIQLIADTMKLRFANFNPLTMFSIGPELFDTKSGSGIKLTGWPVMIIMSATCVMFKNGLFIFLLRQYFRGQPKELEEAAYIDGAGTFRTFWQIMMPSALPIMVTVFLFAFVWQYNDNTYLALIYPQAKVLSMKITTAASAYVNRLSNMTGGNNAVMDSYNGALVILHILPLLLLYICCQKFFVQSIERSGMVG